MRRRRFPWRIVVLGLVGAVAAWWWYFFKVRVVEVLPSAFYRSPQVSPRRLAGVIRRAWCHGAVFDAWSECFDDQLWWQSFREEGVDPDFYSYRHRPLEEKLPWNHISTGVSSDFLKEEYARSLRSEVTPDCRKGCLECGVREIWEEA